MEQEKINGAFSFKKFTGEKLDNIEEYVKEYYKTHDNIDIIVGTDSQNRGPYTIFSTIVAMYDRGGGDGHGHGAHCVFSRWKTRRYKKSEIFDRMIAETQASIDIAKSIRDYGVPVKSIDLDINPNESAGSNVAFNSAKGWVESENFKASWKTLGPLVTTLADWVVKK